MERIITLMLGALMIMLSLIVCEGRIFDMDYFNIEQELPSHNEAFIGTITTEDLPSKDINPSIRPSEYLDCSSGLQISNGTQRIFGSSGQELYFVGRENELGRKSLLNTFMHQELSLLNSENYGGNSYFDLLEIVSLNRTVTVSNSNVAKVSINLRIRADFEFETNSTEVLRTFPSDGIQWFHFLVPYHESVQMANFKAVAVDTKIELPFSFFDVGKLNSTAVNERISPRRIAIFFDESIKIKSSKEIKITYTLGRIMTPFADKISLNDQQILKYDTYSQVLSSYPIKSQLTIFAFTKPLQVITTDGYLPNYIDAEANGKRFSTKVILNPPRFTLGQKLEFKIKGNIPLLYLPEVRKEITFLPWKKVHTKISYKITNEAARLKDQFSRILYMSLPETSNGADRGVSRVVTNFLARVPTNIQSLEYYDDLGFITTASIESRASDLYNLKMIPRYPLYGGWTTQFTLDYVQHISEVVEYNKQRPALRTIKIALDHHLDTIYAEKFRVSVILPSGAVIKKVDAPFDMDYSIGRVNNWFEIFSSSFYVDFDATASYPAIADSDFDLIKITYEASDDAVFWLGFWLILVLSVLAFSALFINRLSFEVVDSSEIAKKQKLEEELEAKRKISDSLESFLREGGAFEIARKDCYQDGDCYARKAQEFRDFANNQREYISLIIKQHSLNVDLDKLNSVLKNYVEKRLNDDVRKERNKGVDGGNYFQQLSQLHRDISNIFNF